jgi:hypothetical protein
LPILSLLLQLDHPLVAVSNLVGVGVVPHVAAQGQDAALDPADMARSDWGDPVRLAGLQHPVPELEPVAARVLQVEFVSQLPGVSGAGDHELHPVEFPVHHIVVWHLEYLFAEEVGHHLPGLRSLHLHRADVGLFDLDAQPHVVSEPLRPEQHVAVGQGEPEMILVETQQHRIVDYAAFSVGDEGVLALPYGALIEIARGEHVGELEGVGTRDLDLPFGPPDVPEGNAFEKLPVLLDRVLVVAWMVMMVVDTVFLNPVPARTVEVRRLEYPRVLQNARVGIDVIVHRTFLLSFGIRLVSLHHALILFITGSKSGSSVTLA